jgi:hypothetical protein
MEGNFYERGRVEFLLTAGGDERNGGVDVTAAVYFA